MTLKCFVQDCKSGWDSLRRKHKKQNKKHPQIFGAPKHWTMLQIWSHVIPASDKSFSITDKICELHFTDDYLSKFHELTLKDGKTVKLQRNYVKLLPGAIPTVFPNFPQYSKKVQKIADELQKEFPLHIPEMDIKLDEHMQSYLNKISEVQKKFISNSGDAIYELEKSISNENINANEIFFCGDDTDMKERDVDDMDFDMQKERDVDSMDFDMQNKDSSVNIENDSDHDHSEAEEESEKEFHNNVNTENVDLDHDQIENEGEKEADEITFDILVENLTSVSKPNSSWSLTSHGKFVMCAKWNKDYQPEKRVVIDSDLNIKVFLKDTEIETYKNCISEIADISNILCILDK